MNPNIPFIRNSMSNSISCLPTSALYDYLLTEEEHQYIANIEDETASIISNALLTASIKAGSSLYTQPELNKVYVRRDSSYKQSDKDDFKEFMSKNLVGYKAIKFSEMK